MNEARRKPTTGRQSPTLFDKWHGIFYMPSRIDEAGHTKAFDVSRSTGGKVKERNGPWWDEEEHTRTHMSTIVKSKDVDKYYAKRTIYLLFIYHKFLS